MSAASIVAALTCGRGTCQCAAAARKGAGLVHCVSHDDPGPSLSVTDEGGSVLIHCHANCSQEDVVDALRERGLWGGDGVPPTSPRRIVASYPFTDERGELRFEEVRYEPKGFAMRRPDGNGGWIWNLNGVERVLYNLPNVVAVIAAAAAQPDDPGWTVYVVEGPKDADALNALGLCATTNPQGAGKWRDPYAECFSGGRVVVIADKDSGEDERHPKGRAHAQTVARSCSRTARSVKVIELPGQHVKDASDWISAGGTREQLEALADAAPEWKPRGELVALTPLGHDGESQPAEAGNSPDVSMEHGICRVTWSAPTSVVFEFDRFDNGRGGETKAEVTVRDATPGLERRLYRAQLNLSAPRSRTEFASALAKRDRTGRTGWPDLVEEAIAAATDAQREGAPERRLSDIDPEAATARLLPHVMDGRVLTLLHGDGGNGKSTIGLASAVAIHTRRADILGMEPTGQRRCLYLDWESDGAEPASRLRQMVGDDLPDLFHVRCAAAIWDETDRLRRIIARQRAELVVIDSVGLACGGVPPESSEAALRFSAALRSLDVGALGIAHVTKNGSEDYPFGSVFWRNTARASWLVKKQQEISASSFVVGLFQKKANTGPASPPLAFEIDYSRGLRISRRDAFEVAEFAPDLPLKWRIQQALKGGPATIVAITEAAGADTETVARTLRRYAGRLYVKAPPTDGVQRWALLREEAS